MDAHSLLHWIVNIVLEVPAGVIRHERNERHEHEEENFSENMIDYVKNPKHTKDNNYEINFVYVKRVCKWMEINSMGFFFFFGF